MPTSALFTVLTVNEAAEASKIDTLFGDALEDGIDTLRGLRIAADKDKGLARSDALSGVARGDLAIHQLATGGVDGIAQSLLVIQQVA